MSLVESKAREVAAGIKTDRKQETMAKRIAGR